MSNLNSITNELLLKYDDKFNELYNKKINIDSSIMNKEELILKENDEIIRKEHTVSILQYTVILIIIFCVLLILNALEKITFGQLILIFIGVIVIYLIIIYYASFSKLTSNNADKILKNIKVDMADYAGKILGANIKPYTCPTTCSTNHTSPQPRPNMIQGYEQPTLNIDPQVNVWQYGDMPSDLFTSNKIPASDFYTNPKNIPSYRNTLEEEIEDEPKASFGTTYPNSTYYKCNWLGGNNNGGLPNIESKTYSSIPCSYRANYEETGKYICSKNPNNLSQLDFDRVCEKQN